MLQRALTVLGMAAAVQAAGQVHVAYGYTNDVLSVSWASKKKGSVSEVMYGLSPDNLNMTNTGDVKEFTADIVRTWYTRSANMTGLKTNTKYFYKVGDATNGYSKVFEVTNRRTNPPYNHILFGDMGTSAAFSVCTACTQHGKVCDDTTCAKNTSVGLVSEVDTADMFLHVGDFAYNLGDDFGELGDQFMRNIEQLASRVPYMVSHGNHEDAPEGLAHYVERFRNQPVNSVPSTYVTMNGRGPNNLYFSWDYGLVHYVSFSTELFHAPVDLYDPAVNKHTLLAWLEEDLKKANANRDVSPWILIHGHRPLYSSSDTGADKKVKEALEPLCRKYGVDFSINGHQHNYERTWPVWNGTAQLNYMNPQATIYVVTGAAGSREMHTPFTKDQPGWSAFRSNTFGYTRMIVHNASHIHWQQVQTDPSVFPLADYGRVIDDVWIVQHHHGSFGPTDQLTYKGEFCRPDKCSSHDHFEQLLTDLEDTPTNRPLWQKIQDYRAKHGDVAWVRKLDEVLAYLNKGSTDKVEWEDGLLDAKERAAYKWIGQNDQ